MAVSDEDDGIASVVDLNYGLAGQGGAEERYSLTKLEEMYVSTCIIIFMVCIQ